MAALRSILAGTAAVRRRDHDRVLWWRWRRRLDELPFAGRAATSRRISSPISTHRAIPTAARTSIRTSSTPGASPSIRRASSGSRTTARRPRRSTTATASRNRWSSRFPPGSAGSASPTGIVFNGTHGFQVTQGGIDRGERLHLRRRSGHDVGLVAEREHDQRRPGRRRRGTGEGLQGPGDRHPGRRAAALRGRLPQRRRRRLRRELRAGRARRRVRRQHPAGRLRAVRHPGDRQPDLRQLRDAGRERARRRRRRGSRRGRCLRHRGQPREASDRARRQAQRTLGDGDGAGRLRHRSATPCSSATSATARSTPSTRRPAPSSAR